MEPLKPEVKKAILESNPQAEPGDVEEYEKLLSARFTVDPDAGPAAEPESETGDSIESRLRKLHSKLFPVAAKKQVARR